MRRFLAVLAATAAAVVALPLATAQAAPACGTTPEQWVGFFPGTSDAAGDPSPLDHTITHTNGLLAVDTLVNDWLREPPYGTPTITGDSLTWITADTFPRGPGWSSIYTTTSVTCANGVVQSFTGTEAWAYGVVMHVVFDGEYPFTASRA